MEIEIKTVKLSQIKKTMQGSKKCSGCGLVKLGNMYHKSSTGRYPSRCIECSREVSRNKYRADPDKKHRQDREYRERNLDRVREADRNRKRDPIKTKESHDKWMANNPGRAREHIKKWESENPDKVMDNSRLKRARRRNAIIEKFSAAEIYERDRWICQFCYKRVDKKLKWPSPMSPSLDHIIPLSKGGAHERLNAQLAHLGCNMHAGTGGIKQMRLL